MDELTVHIEELIVDGTGGGAVGEAAVAAALRDHTGSLLDAAALAEVGRAVVAATPDAHRAGG